MHQALTIIINILAGYRLVRLVQADAIMLPFREWWHRTLKFTRFEWAKPLVDCPWCLSVWMSGVVVAGNSLGGIVWQVLADVLALSAVTGFMAWYDKSHFR